MSNLIKKHAKSFHWASFFLSKSIFEKCSSLYNFCRTLDDLVDENNALYKKKENFLKFKKNFTQKNLNDSIIKEMWLIINSENISKQIDPFVEKAINMLGLEIKQNLAHWADISRHRIQKKLVADCNQCDALCCNASQFATPKYKKTAGAICKNIDLHTLKCQIYNKRKNLGYDFCQRFERQLFWHRII